MKKSLAGTIAALVLWTAACGVSADEESGDRGSDAAAVEDLTEEDWDAGLDDYLADEADGAAEWDQSEESGSDGVVEDDAGSDEPASAPSDPGSSDSSSGGATPGVYVAPDGAVENGYSLRFEVSEDGSMIHSLEADVLETCDGNSTTERTTVGADLAWDIVEGQFSARYEESFDGYSLYTTLEGSFSGTTATGTVRQESVIAGSVCDTYALEFTAQLT